MSGKDRFCGNDSRLIEHNIIDFVISLKEKNLSYSAIHNYVATITAFYKINRFCQKVRNEIQAYRQGVKKSILS
jgi:hypothetical protein